MNLMDQIKNSVKTGNNLMRLIYVNIAVFILVGLPMVIAHLFKHDFNLSYWLQVPASLPDLMHKPWTLITYMFYHIDIWHILFNLLFLYWFGMLFLQFLNERLLLNVYVLGGITGAMVYIAAYNFFPVYINDRSVLLGASAAAMAIMIAISILKPNVTVQLIIWSVKLKYIALITVALDVFTLTQGNPGGHFSHLGGALFGALFIVFYKKGKDITSWMNPIWNFFSSLFTRKPKMKVSYKRPTSDFEYNKQKTEDSKLLDKILDKIKITGYDNLTKEEKEFLFNQSSK